MWTRRTAVLLGIAALTGIIAGFVLDGRPDDRDRGAQPSPPSTVKAPATTQPVRAAAIAKAIAVVETGFSTVDEPGCRERVDPGESCPPGQASVTHHLTYGLVLENTSDQVAMSVPVTITFVDAAGQSLAQDDRRETEQLVRLAPGTRTSLGGLVLLNGRAAGMQVVVGEPAEWMSPGYERVAGHYAGSVQTTVSEVRIDTYDRRFDGGTGALLTYSVHTTVPPDARLPQGAAVRVSAQPAVIFRDAQGTIVGGTQLGIVTLDIGPFDADLSEEIRHFPSLVDARVEVSLNNIKTEEVRTGG